MLPQVLQNADVVALLTFVLALMCPFLLGLASPLRRVPFFLTKDDLEQKSFGEIVLPTALLLQCFEKFVERLVGIAALVEQGHKL